MIEKCLNNYTNFSIKMKKDVEVEFFVVVYYIINTKKTVIHDANNKRKEKFVLITISVMIQPLASEKEFV
jgi:hypothetical protein